MHAEFRPVICRPLQLVMLLWRMGHSENRRQVIKAIEAHKELGEQGYGKYGLTKIEGA